MKILVINGPNINMLGIRETNIYGKKTYQDLIELITDYCKEVAIDVHFFQSNYEGAIVESIQKAYQKFDGIIINPAAYTHTSIAILDALKAVDIPTVEVHLSDVSLREEFRQISYVSLYAEKRIIGKGFEGYLRAVDYLKENYLCG
ncbi:MAG: type II 3-dehydroquinate dehydratase [Erysipelotrichia bacterium]|nr:type II 3-dehydroquinate dehydratase [Erysipelotrichia bacterium]